MKTSPNNTVDKAEKNKQFFTAPLKLPRVKRAILRSRKGYTPHIVFNEDLGRWILKTK